MKEPTATQKRYLQFLADGLTQKQIALKAGRSRSFVKFMLSGVRVRLHLATLHQVIAVSVAHGWIEAPFLDEEKTSALQD